ncbi:MAG TPA: DmsC/YnfH family molybdoenzyme membrane anchor subunit [Opitutaceae bacterium]|jgi:Fe-S-cluster-containing dehydrogenase component/DMSO reductase anchor subunit|nr:DmsC/YnfH family molybdoenzyme membrane anchor subunit [Opitutaceae bacterium]
MNSPVDHFLTEQGRLQTPVARFAAAAPDVQEGFAQMIPLSVPLPGRQYAFEVDLDACTGCKACVAACHALNGLDEHETWRDIGVISGACGDEAFVQTVTTACHHCADPGCLNGCPVLAYEKDAVTGIVLHLDDQCIGCSYCILKCPYDVPKFNPRRGIVRKCDLCSGRLAHGEAPACVQACPTHAIRITTVAAGADSDCADFIAGAPDPAHTRPSTRYVTARVGLTWQDSAAGDAPAPESAHWPLAVMTTLVGMGTGCTAAAGFGPPALPRAELWLAGAAAGGIGLLASVAHLGRPLRAWRIFLGLRRSWMSREALLLALWAAAALAISGTLRVHDVARSWQWAAAAIGIAGLYSSAMIYIDTPRPAWAWRHTAPRFFGGAWVLAAAVVAAAAPAAARTAAIHCGAALAAKLAAELALLRPRAGVDNPWLRRSARLLLGPLRRLLAARIAGALAGAVLLAAAPQGLRIAGLALVALGEGLERILFFRCAAAPRMPGVAPA